MLQGIPMPHRTAQAAARRIQSEAHAHAGRARLLAAELVRIAEVLRQAGVAAIPFKGPAFELAVGQAVEGREMDDLDVIVQERDLERAVAALAALGYAPSVPAHALASPWLTRAGFELALTAPGELLLELHWRLGPAWFPVPIAVGDVFARLRPREILGMAVDWPAPEELFLMHAVDGVKAGAATLRWLRDLAAILRMHRQIDWTRVRGLAQRHGGLGSVRIALAMVEDASTQASELLDDPAVRVELDAAARELALGARRSRALGGAVAKATRRIAEDTVLEGAARNFRWAMHVADSAPRAAAAVMRHLAGPSLADLVDMPRSGIGDGALRARALVRRLGSPAR